MTNFIRDGGTHAALVPAFRRTLLVLRSPIAILPFPGDLLSFFAFDNEVTFFVPVFFKVLNNATDDVFGQFTVMHDSTT